MARTGLRMMPTFPSPSLKFRTVGFPQYGFKASMSDRACRDDALVKPMPSIPSIPSRLPRSFVRVQNRLLPGSESRSAGRSAYRCAQGLRLATPGVLGSGPSSVVSARQCLLRPHPPDSRARSDFAALPLIPTPSLCGHASATHEPFPTFTAALSARAIDLTPAGPRFLSRCCSVRDTRLPRLLTESPPATCRLCQLYQAASNFGAASFAACYGPRVCPALPTGYDRMESRVPHQAF
jgi:hypothetical protein